LAILNENGIAIWSTGTNQKGGAHAQLQDNGQLVVKNANGDVVFSTDKTETCS
jgi:hypothetical protein